MVDFPKINKPILTAIIIFAVVVLTYFLVSPKYNEFKNLQVKIGEKEAEYNGKYEYYAEVNKAYEELKKYDDGIIRIENAVPSESSFGSLVYFFQQKASENGLIAKKIFLAKVSAPDPETGIKEIDFSLNLMGTYSSFKNFIAAMEKSARLFKADNSSFYYSSGASSLVSSGKAQPVSQPIYSFTLDVKTQSY